MKTEETQQEGEIAEEVGRYVDLGREGHLDGVFLRTRDGWKKVVFELEKE